SKHAGVARRKDDRASSPSSALPTSRARKGRRPVDDFAKSLTPIPPTPHHHQSTQRHQQPHVPARCHVRYLCTRTTTLHDCRSPRPLATSPILLPLFHIPTCTRTPTNVRKPTTVLTIPADVRNLTAVVKTPANIFIIFRIRIHHNF